MSGHNNGAAVLLNLDGMRYLPICESCIVGEGSECHTPDCALWMRDVPADGLIGEFALDLAALRAQALRAAADDIEEQLVRYTRKGAYVRGWWVIEKLRDRARRD